MSLLHREIVVPASKKRLAAIAAGSAVFVSAGGWMLLAAGQDSVLPGLLGSLAVVFFGACAFYALLRIARPAPAVVINARGIVDNASALGVGFLAWHEIDQLCAYTFQNQVFLGIIPKDLDAVLAKQSAWKRGAIRANLLLGAAPVNIPQVVLPMSIPELLREIDELRRQAAHIAFNE